jgi:hypothetical protein
MLLVAMLFIGALAPTPVFTQYFFTPAVFTVLASMAAISAAIQTDLHRRQWSRALFSLAVVSLPAVLIGYRDVVRIGFWKQWVPMQVHEQGVSDASIAGRGPVLTLAPIFPLEGGARIYPELATGPFAWRVGPFVDESVEARVKTWDPDNLDRMLSNRPPTLVLVGREKDLDVPLIGYAMQHEIPVIDRPDRPLAGSRTADLRKETLSALTGGWRFNRSDGK